jgi:hypothetical protein
MSFSIWVDLLDSQEFEAICDEAQALHKSMKNVMEIAFAISPLLALLTHGWESKSINSTYLLKVSNILVFLLFFINALLDLPGVGQ